MNNELQQIEQQWRSSLRLTDSQLMAIFPEVGPLLTEQLRQMMGWVEVLENGIKIKRNALHGIVTDEFARWCYDLTLDIAYGERLRTLRRQIATTKRRLNLLLGVIVPGQLSDEAIAQAKEQPIEQLLSEPLRSVGQRLMGRCPLHEDKTPSFVVYKKTNTAWCFGCQQGGDTIKLAQLLHGYSFKEAVNYLNHN